MDLYDLVASIVVAIGFFVFLVKSLRPSVTGVVTQVIGTIDTPARTPETIYEIEDENGEKHYFGHKGRHGLFDIDGGDRVRVFYNQFVFFTFRKIKKIDERYQTVNETSHAIMEIEILKKGASK